MKFSEKRLSDEQKNKIIEEAKEHIGDFRNYFQDNYDNYKAMTKFINGKQWSEFDSTAFKSANRLTLVHNKIRPFIRQLLGEDRDFTVDVKLREIGEDNNDQNPQTKEQVSKEKNDQYQNYLGLVRNIAYHSNSRRIYNAGYTQEIEGGFSAWRVVVIKDGNNNALRVRGIPNPITAYFDTNAKSITKTDGDYSGVITYMSKSSFMRKYKSKKITYPDTFTDPDIYKIKWGDEKEIAVCEEYKREYYKEKTYELEDGSKVLADDLKDNQSNLKIVNTITEEKSRIVHYKFTDHYLLDKSETPFIDLPLIFVCGYSRMIDGKQKLYSYAEDAKDPQRMLNFIASDIAEWLKLSKKAKFMGPAKMIDKFKDDWNNPGTASSYLAYDPNVAPGMRPEVINPPPMPSDLVTQYTRAEQDIQIALGRYDANIGTKSRQIESGQAIFNQAVQGNSVLGEFREGRNEAIAETGKIILQAIPAVYDTERTVSITDDNDEDKLIKINPQVLDMQAGQYNNQKTFAPNKYSIEVDVGASFPMQKSQNAQLALELIRADTSGRAYNLLAEFVAQYLDVSKSYKITKRLKTLVPQNVIAEEEGKPVQPDPMQMMQKQFIQLEMMAKKQEMMDDHMKAMSGHLEAMADVSNAQTNRLKVEMDSGIETERAKAEIQKAESEEARAHMQLQKEIIKDLSPKQSSQEK